MKPVLTRLAVTLLCLPLAGACGISHGAIANHLEWGQIIQGHAYSDPNAAEALSFFLLKLETDASVEYIEFVTPAGLVDAIPNDESTAWGDVETYHWVRDSTHVWEYWGYLADYGDGEYVITLYYTDGTWEQTTVWYGIPGTSQPIAAPVQRPLISWLTYNAVAASPVTFTWTPVTDPAVSDIFLGVLNANNEYVVSDVYDTNAPASDPYELSEARYDMEFALENFYAITNAFGHFYTIDEAERDWLIDNYSHVWTCEGVAFYAYRAGDQPTDAQPVYRFWNAADNTHFLTIDAVEADKLLTAYAHIYTCEGIAFYAWQ